MDTHATRPGRAHRRRKDGRRRGDAETRKNLRFCGEETQKMHVLPKEHDQTVEIIGNEH